MTVPPYATAASARWRRLAGTVVAAWLASAGAVAHAQLAGEAACGPLAKGYGPFDYRKTTKKDHELVEKYHFTPKVEALLDGETTMKRDLGGDIAYLLHAFPNHPRALLAMWRLSDQRKMDQPPGASHPVECYFERALRFAKDDTVVRALFAQFLLKRDRRSEALKQLELATGYAADNPFSQHNIGLVYFDAGEFDKAVRQAHLARKLGLERLPLEERLKGAGKWQDPAP